MRPRGVILTFLISWVEVTVFLTTFVFLGYFVYSLIAGFEMPTFDFDFRDVSLYVFFNSIYALSLTDKNRAKKITLSGEEKDKFLSDLEDLLKTEEYRYKKLDSNTDIYKVRKRWLDIPFKLAIESSGNQFTVVCPNYIYSDIQECILGNERPTIKLKTALIVIFSTLVLLGLFFYVIKIPALQKYLCEKGMTGVCNEYAFREKEAGKLENAKKYFEIACQRDHLKSCDALGDIALKEKDLKTAKMYYYAACEADYGPSCNSLGNIVRKEGDLKTAAELYSKAYKDDYKMWNKLLGLCTAKDDHACFALGKLALLDNDKRTAKYWFNRECKKGNQDACIELEKMKGESSPKP